MFGTVTVYSIIYATIHLRMRPKTTSSTGSLAPQPSTLDPGMASGAARYMIIYPTIYVLCTLPLAAGRMAAMTGNTIPYWYYCCAGASITSCGWLDVILYAFTRRAIVFSDAPSAIDECGLETFGIFRTPEGLWSVRTTVEGGVLVDPTVSTRRREHYKKNLTSDESGWFAPQSRDGGLDDTFDLARPGTITTKKTITITTKPRAITSHDSVDDVTALPRMASSNLDHTPSVHSAENSIMDNDYGKDCSSQGEDGP